MPLSPFVYDASAIVAVFRATGLPYRYWQLADDEDNEVLLAFPVGAMLDAAQRAGVAGPAWDGVLWSPQVRVMPLTESVAKDIGDQSGQLGVRHALWESEHLVWPILTGEPRQYPDGTPLLTFGADG